MKRKAPVGGFNNFEPIRPNDWYSAYMTAWIHGYTETKSPTASISASDYTITSLNDLGGITFTEKSSGREFYLGINSNGFYFSSYDGGRLPFMVRAQGQGVTPFDVGVEWLTGTGPRHRNFTNGDVFTEMLRQHEHVLATKASIPGMIANGKMRGNAPYSLSGVQGVGKYVKDYSTLATGGLTGNLAVTYLGSYNLGWQVTAVNGNSATVQFLVKNSSTIQSATRPPVLGYYSWWQNSVGSWINSSFSSGPMSPTTQTFRWTETVTW